FPPYFVAGAIFSGFAMVITIAVPLRYAFRLEGLITDRHMENMGKILLATGLMVTYSYIMETFFAYYSANEFDRKVTLGRATGVYSLLFWTQIACNVVAPQLLWSRRLRRNIPLLFLLSIVINVGMWLERLVIVINSLSRDYMPSMWGTYAPTFWDLATLIGSLGLFMSLMFLFIRFLPAISIYEVRELLPQARAEEGER